MSVRRRNPACRQKLTDLEFTDTKLFRVLKPILMLNLRFCSAEMCFILRVCGKEKEKLPVVVAFVISVSLSNEEDVGEDEGWINMKQNAGLSPSFCQSTGEAFPSPNTRALGAQEIKGQTRVLWSQVKQATQKEQPKVSLFTGHKISWT